MLKLPPTITAPPDSATVLTVASARGSQPVSAPADVKAAARNRACPAAEVKVPPAYTVVAVEFTVNEVTDPSTPGAKDVTEPVARSSALRLDRASPPTRLNCPPK